MDMMKIWRGIIIFVLASTIGISSGFSLENDLINAEKEVPVRIDQNQDVPQNGTLRRLKSMSAPEAAAGDVEPSMQPIVGDLPSGEKAGADEPAPAPRIDVSFKKTSVRQALDDVARKSGIAIRYGPDISGYVSFSLTDADARDVIKVIAGILDLAYFEEDLGWRVMTPATFQEENAYPFVPRIKARFRPLHYINPLDMRIYLDSLKGPGGKILTSFDPPAVILLDTQDNLEKMEATISRLDVAVTTEKIKVSYAPLEELRARVDDLLTEGLGEARVDETGRFLVITDTAETIARIKDSIRQWDAPRDVLIEAEAVRVVLSDEYRKGIDWEAIVADYRCITGESEDCPAGKRDISIGTISREDYDVLLEALDAVGDMQQAGGPRITALPRRRMVLKVRSVGSDVVVSMTNLTSSEDSPGAVPAPADSIEDGLVFYVTPVVHLDESVTLQIARQAERDSSRPAAQEVALSVTKGTVVVIGGMFQEEKFRTTKKLPLLGDLPFLGLLFQRNRQNTRRIEHVIFLKAGLAP